jgi:hypothetical protein
VVEEIQVPDEVTEVVVEEIPVPPPQAAPQAVPQALAVVEDEEEMEEEAAQDGVPPCPTCGKTITEHPREHMALHLKGKLVDMTVVRSKTISCTLCDYNKPTSNRHSAWNVARHVALKHDEVSNCANQEEREWLKIMERWRVAQSSLKRKATTAPAAAAAAKRSKVIHKCDCCDYETPHRSAFRNHLISVRHAMKAAARKR